MQQLREVDDVTVVIQPAIGVHVLPEQVDLAHAAFRQVDDFGDDVIQRPGHFLAAGVGHDAKCAVFAAAFHHRDEGAGPLDFRLRQVVELLDLRKADIHDERAARPALIHHVGQAVQGLRAEYQVDVGCAPADFRPLLAGHAAAHADDQRGIALFQVLPAPELMKHLFLRLFPYGTGI
jgi:hypothetical protein